MGQRRRALRALSAPRTRRKPAVESQELKTLWCRIREDYFPDRPDIDTYLVRWSTRRQKRVLACCHINRKEIRVAKELAASEHHQWLPALLYHEMCHAVLGTSIQRKRGKIAWHGVEFKALVNRHPGTNALEHWIKSGGWLSAVRSARSRDAARLRKAA